MLPPQLEASATADNFHNGEFQFMFIATLIAHAGALQPALAETLRNAWGGGAVQWLSPDEAAEFSLPEMPGNRWDVWSDLQDM